ncbi:hypothetical protein [Salinibacterium sp. ZJ454]|uniref:hypothetical protein n=1 Tax=Salinibacterium sp. ZJ454 TaxID=2708339 RepID=UPI0014226905|nr:hypothetical protein [Salinibacterium sp. ZJ454]
MTASEPLPWTQHLLRVRDLDPVGGRNPFLARALKGEFVRVVRGIYVRADVWSQLDRHARYRATVKAAALAADHDQVFSHQSAAALWRLPWVGQWPTRVHVLTEPAAGGRSNGFTFRHGVGVPGDVEMIDGLPVTSLARTVVDLSATALFGQAVTAADAALRRTAHPRGDVPRTFLSRDELLAELRRIPLQHGQKKAERVIMFANAAADRPGESMSRVSMHQAGITAPQLQVSIAGASGRVYIVDFWWPEFNVIGEFDGDFKYTDPEFLRGRTPHQVLLDEKDREDDLRATGRGMSRWKWALAISPQRLREHLHRAGVH